MKRIVCLMLALLSVFAMVACGGEEKEEEVEIGTVKIATDGAYAPFNYVENDELIGFEIDVLDEIAKRSGLEIETEVTAWNGIFGQLESGKIDSIVCCIFPSEERLEKYDFSYEYIYDENRIIVPAGKGAEFKTEEDLKGLTVGVTGGGNSFARLEEVANRVGFEMKTYDEELEIYDMDLGRIDAYYKSPVGAMAKSKESGVAIDIAEMPAFENGSCAFPFRKDARSALIKEAFDKAILEMIEDGTMTKLCEEWLGIDVTAYDALKIERTAK